MTNAYRDENSVPTLIASSSTDGKTPVRLWADPITHRLLVDSSSSGGTVVTPTGVVNGSNTTFTVTDTPVYIIVDGLVRFEGYGYTYSAGTITVDPLAPPVEYIRSVTLVAALQVLTFVDSEIVSGSGTAFTLSSTPVLGTVHLFGAGQRLYPTTDFSISNASITTINSWSAGDLLADYQV